MALDDSPSTSRRRKDLFGDCALVEIIHLHECLRGALKALEKDVDILHRTLKEGQGGKEVSDLEGKVNGRFKVIWSVFRAHSSAEDEFIWPALRKKTNGILKGSPNYRPNENHDHSTSQSIPNAKPKNAALASNDRQTVATEASASGDGTVDQESYEEDHADEERMFVSMDNLMKKLRDGLIPRSQEEGSETKSSTQDFDLRRELIQTAEALKDLTHTVSKHLMDHLEKEEFQCMPLVVKHLSKSEIHDLVGQIMGKRSSDMISEIMTMAVQSLNQSDRLEMIKYMKQAMAGTFFDRWLSMSGWMEDVNSDTAKPVPGSQESLNQAANLDKKRPAADASTPSTDNDSIKERSKRARGASLSSDPSLPNASSVVGQPAQHATNPQVDHAIKYPASDVTSQAELEKLIRAIATNPNLDAKQKNSTIQGLRDSVFKSNQRAKKESTQLASAMQAPNIPIATAYAVGTSSASVFATPTPTRRVTPPSIHFKKNARGKIEVAWDSDNPNLVCQEVPLFSASELAPTYHDGATGSVLGCPHYARACKLRHPESGRLYTCRLCCEQERDMPSKDKDEPLDRYAVTDVMCMKCNALQPANDRCINTNCESVGKPFAKYYCKICNLYDDRPRPIFHCPYCNTCRMGMGLGIDFRHCMRCNACVSLDDHDHRCIPQKLQGTCPICHDSLFESTEQLRGLRCGHVMHLSCFYSYRRGQTYSCPLCMKSMDDMSDYFALLDAAVRMQPMPTAYLSTFSNVYCQDCEKTGHCQYHFVGLKCQHCGSYNTRELSRVDRGAEAFSVPTAT